MGLNSKGQARLVEVALAALLSIFFITVTSYLIVYRLNFKTGLSLKEEATTILLSLHEKGLLSYYVYGEGGDVKEYLFKKYLEQSIPRDLGYRLVVYRYYDGAIIPITVIEGHGFDKRRFISVSVVLSGCKGFFEPRIVTLSLSYGD